MLCCQAVMVSPGTVVVYSDAILYLAPWMWPYNNDLICRYFNPPPTRRRWPLAAGRSPPPLATALEGQRQTLGIEDHPSSQNAGRIKVTAPSEQNRVICATTDALEAELPKRADRRDRALLRRRMHTHYP
jgi:hypothetical protein